MDTQLATTLYQQWVDAWNGNTAIIPTIIAQDFVFHREHGQADVRGPQEMQAVVEGSRAAFSDLTFETHIGPLVADEWIIGRNLAEGIYAGGIPGATADAGTQISLAGIDMLRVKDGKVVECWHNGNDLAFMLQLGAVKASS